MALSALGCILWEDGGRGGVLLAALSRDGALRGKKNRNRMLNFFDAKICLSGRVGGKPPLRDGRSAGLPLFHQHLLVSAVFVPGEDGILGSPRQN